MKNKINGNKLSVAIVIPTFNREKVLIDTIESVLSLNPQPDEFWVIDQTAQHEPATEAYLQGSHNHGVKVVRLPEPGVCFARNLGAALSNADIIIYLDDDVMIKEPAFIEKHRNNYLNPEVDAVQGQILEPGQQITNQKPNKNEVSLNYAHRAERLNTIVTANCSIQRSVILKTGGYDEGFSGRTYANEDGDFGLRLFKDEYRIDSDPEASLIHLKAPSGGNRITGRDAFPEWTRSVTFFQYYLRHCSGWLRIWKILTVFRLIALRKENVKETWRLPGALLHTFYALHVALKRYKQGFQSSLFNPGVDYLRKKYLTDGTD